MEVGNIVEYIDRQKIVCAVVIAIKNQRLRLLSENNKEVKLSANRLLHHESNSLDLSAGRDQVVMSLKALARRRSKLIDRVDVRDIWEVLKTEQEWIDLETMTAFCFPGDTDYDHRSAVLRAFFADRLYFKFSPGKFFPNTEEQVDRLAAQRGQEQRRLRLIDHGSRWLSQLHDRNRAAGPVDLSAETAEVAEILRAYYLFGKDSRDHSLARAIMSRSRIDRDAGLFSTLVKAGIFDRDENLDLLRYGIQSGFEPEVLRRATGLVAASPETRHSDDRRDLTHLHLMTIDGQATLDFDDAISLDMNGDHYVLGIHIADVGHFISKGDAIDRDARGRVSSIYMPDLKISMLPPILAEGLCSLRAGALRPAISTMVTLTPAFEIVDAEIVPSLVRVRDQLTYYDANVSAATDTRLGVLQGFAEAFRCRRLDDGAVQINLPEISIWLDENREVNLSQVNRESPGRLLVTEIMILANWQMARLLAEHSLAAVFRSQPKPRQRLYQRLEGSLFQHWMQRRHLSRFALGTTPEKHVGLGLDMYVTATSPIRKYVDLINQRQVRAALGLEDPYSAEEIDALIQQLQVPMGQITRVQYLRHRYWLLKYLEKKVGCCVEATVLMKKRMGVQVLLNDYLIECDMAAPPGLGLKPEDLVQVTIQRVDARKDEIALSLG